MTKCEVCGGVGGLHVMPCHRHRLLSCTQQSGCDGVVHDIRCNNTYFGGKAL